MTTLWAILEYAGVLSALRDWHYLLGCASAQVQSSLKEIPFFSFVMTDSFVTTDNIKKIPLFSFVMTENIKEIPLFSFVMNSFVMTDKQTHKHTNRITLVPSCNYRAGERPITYLTDVSKTLNPVYNDR